MTTMPDADRARLDRATASGSIPTMLAVLVEYTGDRGWLQPRFRPTRSRGMDENASGGLPDEVQAEIRAAFADAVRHWWEQGRPARRDLAAGEVETVLSFTTGETVPADVASMMAEIVNGPQPVPQAPTAAPNLRAIVIGAGVGGMLISVALDRAGIDHVILEKNEEVGGSWWENRYPGAGVDTPSHLYSISGFDHDWSTYFGKRDEVEAYLQAYADAHDIRSRIRFGTEVTRAVFDDDAQRWAVTAVGADGDTTDLEAPVLISAVGLLNRPKVPDLPGIGDFRGRVFHSAHWPAELDEPDSLRDKTVGIIGAGASAMQIAPAIADRVGSMTIFQRSPQWIAPNADYFRPVDDDVHWLMDTIPGYREWYRAHLSWIFNDKVHPSLQIDPDWHEASASINETNHGHRRFYERYIRDQLGDRDDLIAASLPDYPPFGKRMLLDNGWYAMLREPHVDLVARGVRAFTPSGVVDADGVEHALDVAVLATGFQSTRMLYPMEIVGRSGRSTREVWGDDDARAYLGITVPDFPNLFILTGPNTAIGHGGSFITILECQVRYIVDALHRMQTDGIAVLECRPEVSHDYNAEVDARHARMVWTHPAMQNWYRNADGRVVAVLPWRITDYWSMTRQVDLDDFLVEPPRGHAETVGGPAHRSAS
ncbi:flavin-containing monooxygenase [Williamsia deligens]|uniref:Flavin-containing monooxygenase n=1 Tax=Williamsia deligens TaxID=321325 RepID=A0ABW3GCM9_9NOCA|nr:NAD(P)/FAD-dependent oxidoreductase [Williamsia deligens]